MGTKINSNYSDLLTFTRASKGHALRPVSYGTELVDDGTFDEGTVPSGWEISTANGVLSIVNGALQARDTNGDQYIADYELTNLKVGGIYKVEYTDSGYNSMALSSSRGAQTDSITLPTTNGFNQVYVVATRSTLYLGFRRNNGITETIDNVSVKEVFFDQTDGTLTLFEHPDNVPRVEYDADGNRLGLLVEEARTNFLTYSEDFSNAGWIKFPSNALSSETVTGPFEGTSAYRFTSVDHNHYLEDRNVTVVAGTTYTFSFWGKDAGGAGTPKYRIRDISNGTNIARADWPDPSSTEFKRQVITFTAPSGCTNVTISIAYYSGVQIDFYVFGAQLEAGSFPTSYMKNEGTSGGVTRSADVASIPVADFGYNQNEGTLFVEWKQSIGAASYVAMLSDGTATNRSMVRQFANGSAYYSTITNSVSQGDILTGTVVDNQSNKIGVVYKHNDAAGVLNGASAVTDATFLVPEGVSTLSIGSYTVGSSQYINGHIKSIQYYPRRLTNAQLQDLTS